MNTIYFLSVTSLLVNVSLGIMFNTYTSMVEILSRVCFFSEFLNYLVVYVFVDISNCIPIFSVMFTHNSILLNITDV